MPEDEFEDIDVVLERIVILEKAENNILDGKIYSTEQAMQKLEKWLK